MTEQQKKPKKRAIRKLTSDEEADIYRAFFAAGVGFMSGLLTMSRHIDKTFEILQGKEIPNAKRGQDQTISQEKGGGDSTSSQEENAPESHQDS